MEKINPTVRRETTYIAVSVLIFSMLMESIFIIIGKWDYTVLLGNILSAAVAILNFLFMGITIQKATELNEKEARNKMKLSHTLRTMLLFLSAALGCILPCFNVAAVLIPLFFPRIAIAFRPFILKNAQ